MFWNIIEIIEAAYHGVSWNPSKNWILQEGEKTQWCLLVDDSMTPYKENIKCAY